MSKLIYTVAVVPLIFGGAAFAQTSAPAQTSPPTTPPAASPTTPSTSPAQSNATLTDAEAKQWMDKTVYSSDDKNIGEVGAMLRDSSGRITELHVDTGGFLGIGETRVRLMPSQFKLQGDRIVLSLTAEQVKGLPKIAR